MKYIESLFIISSFIIFFKFCFKILNIRLNIIEEKVIVLFVSFRDFIFKIR